MKFSAKKAKPVVVAIGLVGMMSGFASMQAQPAPEASPTALVDAVHAVGFEMIEKTGFTPGVAMRDGSHLVWAQDGSGDYWSVGSDGNVCGLCGPSRASAGNIYPDAATALDDFQVGYATGGKWQGKPVVIATAPNAWPAFAPVMVAKTIKVGVGPVYDGVVRQAEAEVVRVDAVTGEVVDPARVVSTAIVPAGGMVDWDLDLRAALNKSQVGAVILTVGPTDNGGPNPSILSIYTVKTVTVTPMCSALPDGLAGRRECIVSRGGSSRGTDAAPVAHKVGDVTVGGQTVKVPVVSVGGSGGSVGEPCGRLCIKAKTDGGAGLDTTADTGGVGIDAGASSSGGKNAPVENMQP